MSLKSQLAGFTTIETDRLLLRPVVQSDTSDIFEYLHDVETVQFITVSQAKSIDDVIKNSIQGFFMVDPIGKWAIVFEGKMIGTIDMRLNESDYSAEIGYVLNKHYWGRGMMPEAAKAVLKIAFEELHLVRVMAVHDVRNPKSGQVMLKIGMIKEGVALKFKIIKNEAIDMAIYAITDDMYEKNTAY
ncbi:GNAT family N-acetyltransferase [Leuconostoc kimchii]|uniref:Acetyltransferase, GNAT family n=2 Tax=Leuconostoc kimchii TaxID=136609 RepID=D5T3X5_LEUKI|nr:GNAT family protein [Leuconostoc kimchii]ADG41377.1 acetyltransferase, GNAT family [Leuconostoc kimchii IMSNU 11154]QBR47770.1 N-acetyltransferase [Leuconostoc kimchii]